MIPKKIHYCWFGRNSLPESALKCIASWRKFFPDYEIVEWNEENFDVNSIPYTAQAYQAKKYAFVSDYARFKILYEHGGLYFDTDVEVIKSFEDILARGGFMGYETPTQINPGLGLAAEVHNPILEAVIDYYNHLSGFDNPETNKDFLTVVQHTTRVLNEMGAQIRNNKLCEICGITIYPIDWFNPFDSITGRLHQTPNTHSIHWYSKTWLNQSVLRSFISKWAHRIIGVKLAGKFRKIFRIK